MNQLFENLAAACARGEDTVLVTIVGKRGSAPRGVGAHMLVGAQGRLCGTVGGGSGEYEAVQTATRLVKARQSAQRTFRLYPNGDKDLGAVCGGEIDVHFQFLPGNSERVRTIAERVLRCGQEARPCWLILDLACGDAEGISLVDDGGDIIGAPVAQTVREKRPSHPRLVEESGRVYHVERLQQPGFVYIFGGGHVAQALVPVLASVDFRCVVVEDRPEFCKPELFPGAQAVRLIPVERLREELDIRAEDYICVMTRGHANDTECEAFALTTRARYVGVIGSRRKIAVVNERLLSRGFTQADLDRVHTPIGLPIGAETPAEIAISIAAEMILTRSCVGFPPK